MPRIKSYFIKSLTILMVVAVNCCLPLLLQNFSNHHVSSHQKDCPVSERQDIDAVPNLNFIVKDDVANLDVSKHLVTVKSSNLCLYEIEWNDKKNNNYISYKLWGYNSSLSNGVFRL